MGRGEVWSLAPSPACRGASFIFDRCSRHASEGHTADHGGPFSWGSRSPGAVGPVGLGMRAVRSPWTSGRSARGPEVQPLSGAHGPHPLQERLHLTLRPREVLLQSGGPQRATWCPEGSAGWILASSKLELLSRWVPHSLADPGALAVAPECQRQLRDLAGTVQEGASRHPASGSSQVLEAGVHRGRGGRCPGCELAHTQPCR